MNEKDLRELISRNPNSKELSWKVWNSLGNIDGCDVRTQGDVQRCFYILAYEYDGIGDYLKAAFELHEKSGESVILPECFKDKAIIHKKTLPIGDSMHEFIDLLLR